MATAAVTVRPKSAKRRASLTCRALLRESAAAPALTIDRDAGIIYGVKVCGLQSPNNHPADAGAARSTNGTRYTLEAFRAALPLYDGIPVMVDHPEDRAHPRSVRECDDSFGVLRNPRVEADGMRADLHYDRTHRLAASVLEDVERGMGRFALSHNADGAGDVRDGVLVIESIPKVRSVDLVTRGATNVNLWESASVQTTPRKLLEAHKARVAKSPGRVAWLTRLLEDDTLGGPMDAPMDAPAEASSPEDALWSGFEQAIQTILDQYKAGDMDGTGAVQAIKKYISTHEKLTAEPEPASDPEPVAESDGEDKKKDDDEDKAKMESRVEELERKDKCRDLCESLDFVPTKDQLAALCEIGSDKARRTTAVAFKAAVAPKVDPTRPRSRLSQPVLESPSYDDDSYGRATRAARN